MPRISNASYSADAIAEKIGAKVVGDGKVLVTSIAPIATATHGDIAFIQRGRRPEVLKQLAQSKASVILLKSELMPDPEGSSHTILSVKDPFASLVKLVPLFFSKHPDIPGIHPMAVVDPSAQIGDGASIGPFCVVGAMCKVGQRTVLHSHTVLYPGSIVGDDTVIHSGAIIREECVIGENSVIQNGAIIGAEGFGYIPDSEFGLRSVPQVGIVRLAARVEVGANSCIDRATFGETGVGVGTKIDNLVQIGHNAKVGSYSIICGGVGVAGSTTIGDRVTLAGAVGVADHLNIPSDTRVAGGSIVLTNLDRSGDYCGYPAIPMSEWRRQFAMLRRLPSLLKRVVKIERGVGILPEESSDPLSVAAAKESHADD